MDDYIGPRCKEETNIDNRSHASCCFRPVWEEAGEDKCIWHAEIEEGADKPIEELLKQLQTQQKRGDRCELDGAELSGLLSNVSFWTLVDYKSPSELSDDVQHIDLLENTQLLDEEFDNGLSFSCYALRDADFSEANLFVVNFSEANLKCANFSGTDLRCADFSDANLQDADLPGANLRYADLSKAKLQGADFSGADLRDADLSKAKLQGADFSGADLRDADLPRAKLQGADLSDAKLQDANFSNANLRHADLPEAKLCDLEIILNSINSSEANPGGTDLSEANLHNTNLSKTNLHNADLSGSSVLSDANLQDAHLGGANLRHADLSNANLQGAYLGGANLYGANLSKAILKNADFLRADLRDTDLSEADLRKVNFSEADLRGASFKDLGNINMESPTLLSQIRGSYETTRDSSFAVTRNKIARNCHDLSSECSRRGLTKEARELTISERRARRKEAIADSDWSAWIKSWVAWQATGYGISIKQLLRNMCIVFGMGLFVYLVSLPFGPEGKFVSVIAALYFSIVTFTTTPPANPDDNSLRIIAMSQAFLGTLLVVLLGYVLANRASI